MSNSKTNDTKAVLDFLKKQNRPFSAQDVTNFMNGQVGKTAVTSILDNLVADKKINEKLYGKQKVFCVIQNTDITNYKSEVRKLDEQILEKKNALTRVKDENSKKLKEMSLFESSLTLDEAQKKLDEVNAEIEQLKEKIQRFESGNVKPMLKEEKLKITKTHEKYTREMKKYRRIGTEMLNVLVENSNGIKKKDLCDDLGILLDV